MKIHGGILLLLPVLFLMSGCMSTPAKRIQKEPQVFAAFPPEVQEKVKKGKIELGFSRDMVRLAIGLPNRVHTRSLETGDLEIWTYTHSRYIGCYEPSNAGYWYRDRSGHIYHTYNTMWVNRGWYDEYPVLRLEFSADSLKAIERVK